MRNLAEYPITLEEKIEAMKWALDTYLEEYKDEPPIGDITYAALEQVLEELLVARP
jgi:hypothetical protein